MTIHRASPGPRARARLFTWLLAACLAAACEPQRNALPTLPVPDASGLEKPVQQALATAREDVQRAAVASRAGGDAALAEAYGQLGMSYHAHGFFPAAQAAYEAAARLAPKDSRWPYLRGQSLRDAAQGGLAIPAFEAVLAIAPEHAGALHALGKTALEQGDIDKAAQAFERLRALAPAHAAALAGLGKVAMARRQPAQAAQLFEAALQLDPVATRLRQPLAMAWRDAGHAKKAEAALVGFSPQGPEPTVPDPLVEALAAKVATSAALIKRGLRHGREGRFDLAAQAFETAAVANPQDAATQLNLGVSLANIGRLEESAQALQRAVAIEPAQTLAHLNLGLVYDRQGQDAKAATHYRRAIELDPAQIDARLYLADALMRGGQAEAAAALYREAAARRPSVRANLSLAFALVRSGQWAAARGGLERELARDPLHAGVASALVRVLAAAPEDAVRSGARAVELGRALHERNQSPDVALSYAMALAETGQFDAALALQERTVAAAGSAWPEVVRRFALRLAAEYRQSRPAREPWPPGDPAFSPRSPAAAR